MRRDLIGVMHLGFMDEPLSGRPAVKCQCTELCHTRHPLLLLKHHLFWEGVAFARVSCALLPLLASIFVHLWPLQKGLRQTRAAPLSWFLALHDACAAIGVVCSRDLASQGSSLENYCPPGTAAPGERAPCCICQHRWPGILMY